MSWGVAKSVVCLILTMFSLKLNLSKSKVNTLIEIERG